MERLETDMDDLFLKAGELYPLKISDRDWDAVLGKYQNENLGNTNAISGSSVRALGNKRKWILLLILLPLGLTGIIYVYTSGLTYKRQVIPPTVAFKNDPVPEKTSANINRTAGTGETIKSDPDHRDAAGSATATNNPIRLKMRGSADLTAGGINQNEDRQFKNSTHSKKGNSPSEAEFGSKSNIPLGDESPFGQEASDIQLAKPLSLTTVPESNQTISVIQIPLAAPSVEMIPSLKSKRPAPFAQSSKGFYVGFLAGPDISAVKFQSVNQVGFSLGAIVGYRFNKNLALETGILWDKKYYYSKGEYFNKDQAGIPYNILSLNGSCNMFEIPVNLRYDFATETNHGFFVKAGLSTYLMKKESYSYITERYGNRHEGDTTYNNASQNYFSVLQLSAGYELAVSGKTKISIEPYVKIPLMGIGVGGMPISSAGLYLGITHSFH
jgi:outer membrane protein with beta-barrel domain